MFSDYGRDLLRSGIIELKAGNRESARRYLDRAVYITSDPEVMAEAWYWMSQLMDDPVEKRKALENCLSNDLQHAPARRALAILDGKLKPDEIIDPDRLPPAPPALQAADAQRFICPKCGGRMSYSPDGKVLVCEYCKQTQVLNPEPSRASQQDFVLAMATWGAHSRPLSEQVLRCQGCGAQYIMPSRELSIVCAYCGSAHVIRIENQRGLLAPDGILPHAFEQQHAADILAGWVETLKIKPERQAEPPRGLYVPIWSFEVGGQVDYTAQRLRDDGEGHKIHLPSAAQVSDHHSILIRVPVAASRRPSAPLVRLIATFDMRAVQPYDAGYLANWPAELYDVSMADASLEARARAYESVKRELPVRLAPMTVVSTSSARLTIESFQLNLLPVWMTEIRLDGRSHLVLINGEAGAVQTDLAVTPDMRMRKLSEWLADIIND